MAGTIFFKSKESAQQYVRKSGDRFAVGGSLGHLKPEGSRLLAAASRGIGYCVTSSCYVCPECETPFPEMDEYKEHDCDTEMDILDFNYKSMIADGAYKTALTAKPDANELPKPDCSVSAAEQPNTIKFGQFVVALGEEPRQRSERQKPLSPEQCSAYMNYVVPPLKQVTPAQVEQLRGNPRKRAFPSRADNLGTKTLVNRRVKSKPRALTLEYEPIVDKIVGVQTEHYIAPEFEVSPTPQPVVPRKRIVRRNPMAQALRMSTMEVNHFVSELMKACFENNVPVEIIGAFKSSGRKLSRTMYKFPLWHLRGHYREQDFVDESLMTWLQNKHAPVILRDGLPNMPIHTSQIKPGWSGTLISIDQVVDKDNVDWSPNGLCVVVGVGHDGQIKNALKINFEETIRCLFAGKPLTAYAQFTEEIVRGVSNGVCPLLEPATHSVDFGISAQEEIACLTKVVAATAFTPHFCCATCFNDVQHQGYVDYWRKVGDSKGLALLDNSQNKLEIRAGNVLRATVDHITKGIQPVGPCSNCAMLQHRLQDMQRILEQHTVHGTRELSPTAILRGLRGRLRETIEDLDPTSKRRKAGSSGQIAYQDEELHKQLVKLDGQYKYLEDCFHRLAYGREMGNDPITRKYVLEQTNDAEGNIRVHNIDGAIRNIINTRASAFNFDPAAWQENVIRWGTIGRGRQYFFTSMELLHHTLRRHELRRVLDEKTWCPQSVENCVVKDGDINLGIGCCSRRDGAVLETQVLHPTPSTIRVGPAYMNKTLNVSFKIGNRTYALDDGFCYIQMFLVMLPCITTDEAKKFATESVPAIINRLGAWPLFLDLLEELRSLAILYPGILESCVPSIIVSHTARILHVVSVFGLRDYGFHQLNVSTLSDILNFLNANSDTAMLNYRIGGKFNLKTYTKALTSHNEFVRILDSDREMLVEWLLSPTLLYGLAKSMDRLHLVDHYMTTNNEDVALALIAVKVMAENYNLHRDLRSVMGDYLRDMVSHEEHILKLVGEEFSSITQTKLMALRRSYEEETSLSLFDRIVEKKCSVLAKEESLRGFIGPLLVDSLSWGEFVGIKFKAISYSVKESAINGTKKLKIAYLPGWFHQGMQNAYTTGKTFAIGKLVGFGFNVFKRSFFPSAIQALMAPMLLGICFWFISGLKRLNMMSGTTTVVEGSRSEGVIPKFMAFMALITVFFNSDWADAWFTATTKFRTLVSVLNTHQTIVEGKGIEDLEHGFESIENFVDIILETEPVKPLEVQALTTCGSWIEHKISMGQLGTNPSVGGQFVQMTTANVQEVVTEICNSTSTEFLVQGAVGSGKSTLLPSLLSNRGKVLLCEPTRALVSNIECALLNYLQVDASVMMRGYNKHGTGGVTVTTYGYALHWILNNPRCIDDFEFIQFDECHVHDANAIVFYNWMQTNRPSKVIIKTSATPAGRDCKLSTKFEVKQIKLQSLTLQNFASQQGTGVTSDATQYGGKILIFVASFNEVDTLSDLLRKKNYGVIKADSRHLRNSTNLNEKINKATDPHVFIVATNAVENGVTLDVDVVVDFGSKIRGNLVGADRALSTERVSVTKGERIQRLGRVGRLRPGVAMQIGTALSNDHEIPCSIATEATLLSFAYNVPPLLLNAERCVIDNLTTKQVRTATHFELNTIFVSQFINGDGSIPVEVYEQFKPLLLRQATLSVVPRYYTSILSNGWYDLRTYATGGYYKGDQHLNVPFPFYTHEISTEGIAKLAEAVCKSNHATAYTMHLPTVNSATSVARFRANPLVRDQLLNAIETLLESESQITQQFNISLASTSCSTLTNLFGSVFARKQRETMERSARNVATLQLLKNQLQQFDGSRTDTSLEEYLRLNPMVATCIYLEGKPTEIISANILGKKQIITMGHILTIVGGITILLGLYYLVQTRVLTNQLDLEGKKSRNGKSWRVRRDQKYDGVFNAHGNADTLAEFFGSAYDKENTKRQVRRGNPMFTAAGKKTTPFHLFYDVDPADFDFCEIVDPATGLMVQQPTRELDLQEAQASISKQFIEENTRNRLVGPEFDGELNLVARFGRFGEDEMKEVDITPHNPLRLTKMGTGIVGYPDRQQDLRQTGPSRTITRESEIGLEGKSLVRSAAPIDHFKSYTVLIKNKIWEMKGVVVGRRLFCNSHFMKDDSIKDFTMFSAHGDFVVKCGQAEAHKFDKLDFVCFDLPHDIPQFKSKLTLRKPRNLEKVVLIIPMKTNAGIILRISGESTISQNKEDGSYWRHYITTEAGDCGSLLVSMVDQAVVGFHSGKSQNAIFGQWNIFTPVTNEIIEARGGAQLTLSPWVFKPSSIDWGSSQLVDKFGLESIFPFTRTLRSLTQMEGFQAAKLTGGNLILVGALDRTLNTRHTIKGQRDDWLQFISTRDIKWVESLMGQRLPSILSTASFYKDLLKYDKPVVVGVITEELLSRATARVIEKLESAGFKKNGCQIRWNADEIINDLNWNTAMGACYTGKKKAWFEGASQEDIETLVKTSVVRLATGKSGVWTGSLKAELRPKEKVEQGKTRVFTAAPIDVLLAGKMVVDSFNKQFYINNLRGPWTVGINKFGLGWHQLAGKFFDCEKLIDADGSQFDSSIPPVLFQEVLKIRLYFNESNELAETMLNELYAQIVYTAISTVDGGIVKKFRGNNSGQPSTVVDNTLILMLAMEYTMELNGYTTIRYMANGDDLLIGGSDEEIKHFSRNAQTSFSQLGLNYNFDDMHDDLATVEYMSHSFKLWKGVYIPKLTKERIIGILEWERSADIDAYISTLNAALIESYGHDDVYQVIKQFIDFVGGKYGIDRSRFFTDEAVETLYLDPMNRYFNPYIDEFTFGEFHTESIVEGGVEQKDEVDKNTGGGSNPPVTPPPLSQGDRRVDQAGDFIDGDTHDNASKPQFPKREKKIQAWIPPKMRSRAKDQLVQQYYNYKPDQMLVMSGISTQEQLNNWIEGVKKDGGYTDEVFNTLLIGWIVWCIENGTSKEMTSQKFWSVEQPNGEQESYPNEPWVKHAQPTLRSVMRNFSDIARSWIAARTQDGHYVPTWGQKGGLTNPAYAHIAYDFWVPLNATPIELELHNQMTATHLTGVKQKMLSFVTTGAGASIDMERHMETDVDERRHNYNGATLT